MAKAAAGMFSVIPVLSFTARAIHVHATWVHGGTLDIHSERVVSVLRGAFFEAIRPAR